MALTNSQYYSIMREYEQRQLKNHDIQTAHYNEVCEKLPEFKALDDSIAILSVQYGKKLLNGDEKAVSCPRDIRKTIWLRFIHAETAKIPDISAAKNVTVSKRP